MSDAYDRALKVWVGMADMYGDLWTRACGDSPEDNPTWRAGIGYLSSPQVLEGLRRTEASGREFPPSWPVFKSFCMAYHDPQEQVQQRLEYMSGGRFKARGNLKLLKVWTDAHMGDGTVMTPDAPPIVELNRIARDFELIELDEGGESDDNKRRMADFDRAFEANVVPLV